MTAYDSIIIGAGHNGLVCGTLLAKAGKRVLILEAGREIGGLAANREFHDGFSTPIAHGTPALSSTVVKDLSLEQHGLKVSQALATVCLGEDGNHVSTLGDTVSGVDAEDAAKFPEFRAKLKRYAKIMRRVWENNTPAMGNVGLKNGMVYAQTGLSLRLLGKDDMGEFVRVATLPMRDLIDEVFEDPKLQALLSWDGLIGSKMAPRSPNNAVLPLLLRTGGLFDGDHCVPEGGIAAFTGALQKAAEAAGVEIRTKSTVERITVDADENGQRITGVALAGGETIAANAVLSSADPQTTFFKLLGADKLNIQFAHRMKRYRSKGYVAKLHMALSDLPKIPGVSDMKSRMIIAPEFDAIEFAYDDAKYGAPSETPVMEITFPSLHDSKLAPTGQHVLSAHVMYAPSDEKTGWSADARAQFLANTRRVLDAHVPGLADLVIHQELMTPTDIEAEYHLTGGHWHHGELSIDQMFMMRPIHGSGEYTAPIDGLYLCGAGTHPGGGLTGLAGRNAAKQVLS